MCAREPAERDRQRSAGSRPDRPPQGSAPHRPARLRGCWSSPGLLAACNRRRRSRPRRRLPTGAAPTVAPAATKPGGRGVPSTAAASGPRSGGVAENRRRRCAVAECRRRCRPRVPRSPHRSSRASRRRSSASFKSRPRWTQRLTRPRPLPPRCATTCMKASFGWTARASSSARSLEPGMSTPMAPSSLSTW